MLWTEIWCSLRPQTETKEKTQILAKTNGLNKKKHRTLTGRQGAMRRVCKRSGPISNRRGIPTLEHNTGSEKGVREGNRVDSKRQGGGIRRAIGRAQGGVG